MGNKKPFDKIQRNSDFLRLKSDGFRYWATAWLLFNHIETGEKTRLGITASRKVGSAVIRNKLKRWSREIARSYIIEGDIFHGDINVIFKPMPKDFYKELEYQVFKEAFSKGWKRIRKSNQKNSSASHR